MWLTSTCAHSFTRNWQLPFLNQQKGKMTVINISWSISTKKILPDPPDHQSNGHLTPTCHNSHCDTKSHRILAHLDPISHKIFKSHRIFIPFNKLLFDWLCWGLTTRQPLWVILCRLPEKGRKEIEEIVDEMKERTGKKEEQEWEWRNRRNKNIPLLPLPATRIAGLAQL